MVVKDEGDVALVVFLLSIRREEKGGEEREGGRERGWGERYGRNL